MNTISKERFSEWARARFDEVCQKGIDHWLWVAVLTTTGLLVGQWFGSLGIWQSIRYKIYQIQTSKLHIRQPFETRTIYVLIDDEEYWKGEPARRVPIKRDYVARLLCAVDKADPELIALDFDFRSPVPSGELVENHDYQSERDELLKAILDVAHRRSIVIPKQIERTGGTYREQADIFRGFDFSPVKQNIFPGYIQLANDLRVIPPPIRVNGGEGDVLDSFALAIIHAIDFDMYNQIVGRQNGRSEVNLGLGTFLDKASFENYSVSAADVLAARPGILTRLGHKVVIIGGKWHERALGTGAWNDEHNTPAGRIIGAYVQGNYAEVLRTGNWTPAWSEVWAILVELACVLGASVVFSFKVGTIWKVAAAFIPSVLIMFASYVLYQNLGLFFDFFVPLTIISAHAVTEHLQWKD